MATKRVLHGGEDLIGWEVLTWTEQAKAFSMFAFVFAIGMVVGVVLVKAGVFG